MRLSLFTGTLHWSALTQRTLPLPTTWQPISIPTFTPSTLPHLTPPVSPLHPTPTLLPTCLPLLIPLPYLTLTFYLLACCQLCLLLQHLSSGATLALTLPVDWVTLPCLTQQQRTSSSSYRCNAISHHFQATVAKNFFKIQLRVSSMLAHP